jgi:vacuolar-type H+-ATPase subunit C/Vma6
MGLGTLTVIGLVSIGGFLIIAPSVKLALDLAPYIYSNTRCSARTGLIINKTKYDELLSASYGKESFAILEDTAYNYVVEHSKDFDTFSKELEKHISETYSWLQGVVPPQIESIIKALRKRFEIDDIKRAINNLKAGKPMGELNGIIDEELKLKLEGSADFMNFSSVMEETIFKSCFANKTIEDFAEINTKLDAFYYQHVLSELQKEKNTKPFQAFFDYWRCMIDIANIRMIIRKITGTIKEVDLIDGGYLSNSELQNLTELDQLENTLQSSRYKETLAGKTPLMLEQALFKQLLNEGREIGAKYNLMSGPVVKYIIQKEIEIRNLSVLIKLKLENFDKEEIEKLLIR